MWKNIFPGSHTKRAGDGSKPFPTVLMNGHQLCIKRVLPQPQVFVTNHNSCMHAHCASSPKCSTIFICSTLQLAGQGHQLNLFLLLLLNSVWGLSILSSPLYVVCAFVEKEIICAAHENIFFEDYWTTLVPNSVKLHLKLLVYFCFLIQYSQWLVCFV
jgi:hypothetical protein